MNKLTVLLELDSADIETIRRALEALDD